jgi:hypothetical protein
MAGDVKGVPIPATQKVIPGGRLDLVIETDDTRVVIESKLASGYHDDQLGALHSVAGRSASR